MAKVGTGVLDGLRKASQLPAWPNARETLWELYAILDEWCDAAAATSRYARGLSRLRNDPSASQYLLDPGPTQMSASNIGLGYVEAAIFDAKAVMDGRVPALARIRASRRRRALRRGLRTILSVYCPALLDQFEEATAARAEWVQLHRKDFDRWFDDSHTDAEVTALLAQMDATRAALLDVTGQLRDFITTNYPLPGTGSNT